MVEGAHHVPAGVELDREVADFELCHYGPANAVAGSTDTARRSAARLASKPMISADTGSRMYALEGVTTGWAKIPRMKLAMTAPSPAATSDTSVAWTANPANSTVDEDPSALSTAKSCARSNAETYTNAATITAAINHMRKRELEMDDRPAAI